MFKTIGTALTTGVHEVATAARRFTDPTDGGLFARSWMTTVGLMAVNVSLAAALVVSPTMARAAQEPLYVCNWCYEGWSFMQNRSVHATSKRLPWFERYPSGLNYYHRNDDGLYPGRCEEAHFVACCEPEAT